MELGCSISRRYEIEFIPYLIAVQWTTPWCQSVSTRHHQLCLTIIVSRVSRFTIVDKNTNLKSFTEERIPDPLSLLLNVSKSIQLRIFEAAQMFRAIGLLFMCLLLLTSHTSLYVLRNIYDCSNDIFACFSPLLVFALHMNQRRSHFSQRQRQ